MKSANFLSQHSAEIETPWSDKFQQENKQNGDDTKKFLIVGTVLDILDRSESDHDYSYHIKETDFTKSE